MSFWVDTHCHFNFFGNEATYTAVCARAQAANVNAIIAPATVASDFALIAKLTATYPPVYGAIGLHPWWVHRYSLAQATALTATMVEHLNASDKLLAIGEIGLDKHAQAPMALQSAVFALQLDLAVRLALPVIIHCVGMIGRLQEILAQAQYVPLTGIIHGWSGSVEEAQKLIDKGFLLGIGSRVLQPRAKRLRRTVQVMAKDAFVLETDAPTTKASAGLYDEPADIPTIGRQCAELRGQSIATLQRDALANIHRLLPQLRPSSVVKKPCR